MTHWLINANRECQGTKQINSPGTGKEASFNRDARSDSQPAEEREKRVEETGEMMHMDSENAHKTNP